MGVECVLNVFTGPYLMKVPARDGSLGDASMFSLKSRSMSSWRPRRLSTFAKRVSIFFLSRQSARPFWKVTICLSEPT